MRISVVIPVFEDREELMRHLPSTAGADEVMVVDATRQNPLRQGDLPPGTRLLRSEVALRSHQMNLGASQAEGEVILFLHADTQLPEEACAMLRGAMENPAVAGGGFEREFDSSSRFLKWTCRVGAWRCRRFGLFLGDQAIFVRRTVFETVGGFGTMRLFEDYDLCRRLKKVGILRCLQPPVVSSARRFASGALWRSVKDFALTLAFFASGGRLVRAIRNDEINVGSDPRTT